MDMNEDTKNGTIYDWISFCEELSDRLGPFQTEEKALIQFLA